MRKISLGLFLLCSLLSYGQEAREKVKKGNQAYNQGSFGEAEVNYREALKASEKDQVTSQFNLGNALFKQERFEEAIASYEASLKSAQTPAEKAEAYHNLGNTYLKNNKIDEAIEAYKNALRQNPEDEETRYNLAKAMEQKRQNEMAPKPDNSQEPEEEKDQPNQGNQQDQDQQEDPKNQNQQNQNPDQSKPNQGEEQEQQKDMDRKNIERLLEALNRREEKTQAELLKKKMKLKPSKNTKDW